MTQVVYDMTDFGEGLAREPSESYSQLVWRRFQKR